MFKEEQLHHKEILKTISQSDPDIEKAWAKEARCRLDEYEKGGVTAIPGGKNQRNFSNAGRNLLAASSCIWGEG